MNNAKNTENKPEESSCTGSECSAFVIQNFEDLWAKRPFHLAAITDKEHAKEWFVAGIREEPDPGYYIHCDELIEVLKNAYPDPVYCQSPLELVQRLIDERAEFEQGLGDLQGREETTKIPGYVLGDYDKWHKKCQNCGYDPGKSDSNRCWQCGETVCRDFSSRALKVGNDLANSPELVCPDCGHHPLTLEGKKTLGMPTNTKAFCDVCPYGAEF